uniref:Uncharacterized protein n=1 Tax=Arundo donax TaxID=35708 RepID=A0A0A8YK81_ARUDO
MAIFLSWSQGIPREELWLHFAPLILWRVMNSI